MNTVNGGVRAAVSDGAGDAYLSGPWARLLCEAYCQMTSPGNVLPSLNEARSAWETLANQAAAHSILPWFALEEQRARGAYAAFIGITLYSKGEDSKEWEAVGVGDCCLFQVREETLVTAFPLSRAGDFNSVPALLSTKINRTVPVQTTQGEWQDGDNFFLMSDALAAWFLAETEQSRAPWRWLSGTGTVEEFRSRITKLRESGRLRNDDVALVHLRAEAG